MENIIIRTAKKEHVCRCCGRLIHKGEKYLDKVILHDGKPVRHDRYHDECPKADPLASLAEMLAREGGSLPVNADGEKLKVSGILWEGGEAYLHFTDWSGSLPAKMAWKEAQGKWRLSDGRLLGEI